MAYGYERGFITEHTGSAKRVRVNCKDCINYDSSDRSCGKRPLYMPEDGYDFWKSCKFFEVDPHANNYEDKLRQAKSYKGN